MSKKLGNRVYRRRVKRIHEHRIDVLEKYINSSTKILHICNICKYKWKAKPNEILKGKGCFKCKYIKFTKSNNTYKSQLKENGIKHKPIEEYKGANIKILHECHSCLHKWNVVPNSILKGSGCPKCRLIKLNLTHKQYLIKLEEKNIKYIPLESYIKNNIKILHKCNSCNHIWKIRPSSVLSGRGCPICNSSNRYSNMGIKYVEYMSKYFRLKFQHAMNDGEFCVPNTNYRVDGYNKRKKIILELYGDRFHGNLRIFRPYDRPHPWSNKTAKQLYKETIKREEKLKSLGYTVISIWESDFKELI